MKKNHFCITLLIAFFFMQHSMAQFIPEYSGDHNLNLLFKLVKSNSGKTSYVYFPLSRPEIKESYPYFEAASNTNISVFEGKEKHSTFWKHTNMQLGVNLLLRMYNEESSPIHPMNFEPGIVFNHFFNPKSYSETWLNRSSTEINNYYYCTLEAKHLSNGQSGPFYIPGTDSINYENGDFSTNFVKLKFSHVNRGLLNPESYLIQTYGIRIDWGIPGTVLRIQEGLLNSYGKYRLIANYQWISRPFSLFNIKATSKLGQTDETLKFRLITRVENTYIIGNLTNFPDENTDKDRYNFNARVTLYPIDYVEMGLFVNFFVGRDYYNLKFTDKKDIWSIGLTYNL